MMNIDEIKTVLSNPTEIFYSFKGGENCIHLVNLVYPELREEFLKQVAEDLRPILKKGSNTITINRTTNGQCDLMISSDGLQQPWFFENVKCMEHSYTELLLQKEDEQKVELAFYIYIKEIQKTTNQIEQTTSKADYDPDAVITADEPTFISVNIPVEGVFTIKSDDDYTNPANFGDEIN